ncbi:hypothetical protein HK100_001981, partial [Physocladia obscura]
QHSAKEKSAKQDSVMPGTSKAADNAVHAMPPISSNMTEKLKSVKEPKIGDRVLPNTWEYSTLIQDRDYGVA